MGIGNLGLSELLIVAVIVLVFFGPGRLPEIGRSVGGALREFKKGMNEVKRELEDVERRATGEADGAAADRERPAGRVSPPGRIDRTQEADAGPSDADLADAAETEEEEQS